MNKQMILAISIMRMIGMFFVALGNHFIPRYYPGFITSAISQFLGFVGVGMFFAVSGYIFGCKAKTDKKLGSAAWFYKRMRRILIPYWIVLLGVVIVRMTQHCSIQWQNIAVSILNIQGILQLQCTFPELGHTWFISILMVCYLLTCIWVRLKDTSLFWKIHWIVYLLTIVVFAGMNQLTSVSYTGSILLFSFMFYSGYQGLLDQVIGGEVHLLYSVITVILMLVVRTFAWVFCDETPFYAVTVVLAGCIAAISYVCFVVLMVDKCGIASIPKSIHCLSELSYEFYLVHALFISGATSLYGKIGNKMIEIVFLLCITFVFAYAIRKVSHIIIQKG